MTDATIAAARVISPADCNAGQIGGIGVRFIIDAARSGGGFSLVEHPMPPRALGSPLHRHIHEDEYSYVVEGRVGAQLADHTVYAEPGDVICKPRGQWHAFWNAGDEPARILEIISPGGFESYFERLARIFAAGGPPDLAALAAVAADHALDLDLESIPRLMQQHGLR